MALSASPTQASTDLPREECRAEAARLLQRIGAADVKQDLHALSAALARGRFELACSGGATEPTIILSYPSEYPPEAFYAVLGDIAARASNESPQRMKLRAHLCHRGAKRAANGRNTKTFGRYRLNCSRDLSRSSFALRKRHAHAIAP